MTKGNAVGKDNKTIGINMKIKMAEELSRRAASMNLPIAAYARIILREWIDSDKKLTLKEK